MTSSDNEHREKYFFDISGLLSYVKETSRYSGIQRVVVEMIAEFSQLIDESLIYLCWTEKSSGKYVTIRLSDIGLRAFVVPEAMRMVFYPLSAKEQRLTPLNRYRSKRVKYVYHRTRLDLMSYLGNDKAFRKWNLTATDWRKMRQKRSIDLNLPPRPEGDDFFSIAQENDHLLLLDSTWHPSSVGVFKDASRSGLQVHTLIYDLIPINAPHYVPESHAFGFLEWLLESSEYSSSYLAISEAACDETLAFFAAHGISKNVTAVPLTQSDLKIRTELLPRDSELSSPLRINLDAYPIWESLEHMDPRLLDIIRSPYVLCVGTMETRKNMWRTTMAWKYLIDQGHVDLPQLVFAGRRGWLSKRFEQLLKETGNVYGYVHIVDSPSDEQLRVLYTNCVHALMTSLYEGWGLPVGEALAYGKTAVVSDSSSLPEVGGDMVEYCDPRSVRSIAEAVLRLQDPARRAELEDRINATKLRGWSDVAKDILVAIRPEVH